MRRGFGESGRQRGMALIMVLWGGMLLTVMAASFAFGVQVESTIARSYVDRARAEALAEAGVRRGILALLAAPEDDPWHAAGGVHRLPFDGGELRIALTSEDGKIDLNRAPDALIAGLFESLGESLAVLEPEEAKALAEAVLNRREPERGIRLQLESRMGVRREHRGRSGRDGEFLAVAELNDVPGMRPEVFAALAGAVTVHSGSPKVDPASAPRLALLAVPGLDSTRVDQFLLAREAAYSPGAEDHDGDGGRLPLDLLGPGARYLSGGRASVYTVTAEGIVPGGVSVRRKAIVQLYGKGARPYEVLSWFDTPSDLEMNAVECCGAARVSQPVLDTRG